MNKFAYKVDKQLIKYIKEVACNDVNSYFNQLPNELIYIITEFTNEYYPVMMNNEHLLDNLVRYISKSDKRIMYFNFTIKAYGGLMDMFVYIDKQQLNNEQRMNDNIFAYRYRIHSKNFQYIMLDNIDNSMIMITRHNGTYIYNHSIEIISIQPIFINSFQDVIEYTKMINI